MLQSETNIDGVATVEAYQVTDQCVELATREQPAFSQSKTDPRVAKTRADCTFVVEKKEQRKATIEHFVSRVFDIARPFQSFLTSGFTIENRPTDPQTSESMASYLRARRSKGESFLVALSDLHFLLFLSNLLDMATDMPILCSKVRVRVRVRVRIRFSYQPPNPLLPANPNPEPEPGPNPLLQGGRSRRLRPRRLPNDGQLLRGHGVARRPARGLRLGVITT